VKAVVPEGMTLGELVDDSIDKTARYERDMVVAYVRGAADDLLVEQLFPPNLINLIADLLRDIADGIEACEHYGETEEEGVTIQ